ncbi:hypothetical protein [Fredinandcohnia sp. 179-A 10B2 NHS]|uniref:hypothetical protein n=1 Tax=Fredinandcohnia sp. 179-A 10B2 NHS TaxID=3235176 RepID=UPI00399EF88D
MNIDPTMIYEKMPDFNSHEEAREWFKSEYQDKFLLRTHDEVDGKKVFFYHIVKDPEVYQQYMESFAKPGEHEITNMKTFESYSTVEISEDGDISITQ